MFSGQRSSFSPLWPSQKFWQAPPPVSSPISLTGKHDNCFRDRQVREIAASHSQSQSLKLMTLEDKHKLEVCIIDERKPTPGTFHHHRQSCRKTHLLSCFTKQHLFPSEFVFFLQCVRTKTKSIFIIVIFIIIIIIIIIFL